MKRTMLLLLLLLTQAASAVWGQQNSIVYQRKEGWGVGADLGIQTDLVLIYRPRPTLQMEATAGLMTLYYPEPAIGIGGYIYSSPKKFATFAGLSARKSLPIMFESDWDYENTTLLCYEMGVSFGGFDLAVGMMTAILAGSGGEAGPSVRMRYCFVPSWQGLSRGSGFVQERSKGPFARLEVGNPMFGLSAGWQFGAHHQLYLHIMHMDYELMEPCLGVGYRYYLLGSSFSPYADVRMQRWHGYYGSDTGMQLMLGLAYGNMDIGVGVVKPDVFVRDAYANGARWLPNLSVEYSLRYHESSRVDKQHMR